MTSSALPTSTGGTDGHGQLPAPVARYADYGVYGLVLGTLLCLFALFTNPVPDPSFTWFSLPASLRLPVAQPRIEHWPVSYTVGIWLWVVGAPALFLQGYRRFARGRLQSSTLWLVALPTTAMVALTTYCRFFWPKLSPPTWNAPSYTLVCWLYCSTYDPVYSNAAYAVAAFGVAATALAARRTERAPAALVAFGLLAFPLGIPAIVEGYRRYARDPGRGPAGSEPPASG